MDKYITRDPAEKRRREGKAEALRAERQKEEIWYREYLFAWTLPQRELENAREKLISKVFGPSGNFFLHTVNSWNRKPGGGTVKSI